MALKKNEVKARIFIKKQLQKMSLKRIVTQRNQYCLILCIFLIREEIWAMVGLGGLTQFFA